MTVLRSSDKSILSQFDVLAHEHNGTSSSSSSSDSMADAMSVYEMNGLNRPPMNQEEFDERFAYKRPDGESDIKRVAKKYVKRYYKPFTSCKAFFLALQSFIPIISWLPKYSIKENLFYDIAGGLTVGIMHIPQGIAYASLANVPAVVGLYTSFFPVLTYMLFGTSRHCSIGSFAVVALMSGNAVEKAVGSASASANGTMSDVPDYTQAASALCFLIGVILLTIGVLGLGFITTYFSDEVVAGFSVGASVHVFTLQLKDLFGFKSLPKRAGLGQLFERYADMIGHFNLANYHTILLSAATISVLLLGKFLINPLFQKKCKSPVPIPFELLVVILGALGSYLLKFNDKYDINTVGAIQSSFPAPAFPHFELMVKMIPDAFAISMVIIAIHISLAKMLAKKNNYEVDSTQEFYALGITSVVSGFFPVFPISCSLARTMVNSNAGTKTMLASVFSCAVIGVVILFAGSLLKVLPMSVLAAIIIVALITMVEKFKGLFKLWPISKIDFSIWLVAFASTVCWDVMQGLAISIAFALFTTVIREQWPRWHLLANLNGTTDYRDLERYRDIYFFNGVCIFRFDSPLLFTNVERFKKTTSRIAVDWADVRKRTNTPHTENTSSVRHLIIDCSGFTFIDFMGANTLKEVYAELSASNIDVSFAGAKAHLREMFEKSKLYAVVSKKHFYPTIYDAVACSRMTTTLHSNSITDSGYDNTTIDIVDEK